MLAASVGMNLFRQIAEQNIKQSRQSMEELGNVTRRMVDDFGNQASAICEHSLSLAEETMSNTFDCGFKMLRRKTSQRTKPGRGPFISPSRKNRFIIPISRQLAARRYLSTPAYPSDGPHRRR
jgi:hypothetical protein